MNALTSAWLYEVIGDHITIAPNDINFEARENQWSFDVTPEDAAITLESAKRRQQALRTTDNRQLFNPSSPFFSSFASTVIDRRYNPVFVPPALTVFQQASKPVFRYRCAAGVSVGR